MPEELNPSKESSSGDGLKDTNRPGSRKGAVAILGTALLVVSGFVGFLANSKALLNSPPAPSQVTNQTNGSQSPLITGNTAPVTYNNNINNINYPPVSPGKRAEAKQVEVPNEPVKKAEGDDSKNAFIDCQGAAMPFKFPSVGARDVDGRAHIYYLGANENSLGGLLDAFGPPGSPGPVTNPSFGYRCELTNYSNRTITSIWLLLRVRFYNPVSVKSGGIQEGALTLDHPYRALIPKLDPGPNGSFVFFVYNDHSKSMIQIELPEYVTGTVIGDSAESQIKLSKTAGTRLTFVPVD